MIDDVREFARLTRRKRELASEATSVEVALRAVEARLLEAFVAAGVQKIQADGMTVYLRRELWAGPRDGDHGRACAALSAAGLDAMLMVSTQRLSAWVREFDAASAPLPPEVAATLTIREVFRIGARSG